MPSRRVIATAVVSFTVGLCAAARADSFTIDQWFHDAGVFAPGSHDVDYWTSVENPCQRTIFAAVGSSSPSATLNYAWGEQFGTFLFQPQQQAVAVAGGGRALVR